MPMAAEERRDASADDEQLLRRAAAGEERAFALLLRRHLPAVLALAERLLGSRAEAEDVAQETFLRLWRKAPSWRADGPPLAAWLHRIALSLCHKAWRRLGRQTEAPTADLPDPTPLPPEQAQRAEEARRLRAALAELPLRQRAALALFYDQQLGVREIAESLGIGVHAAESLLARARRRLARRLSEEER